MFKKCKWAFISAGLLSLSNLYSEIDINGSVSQSYVKSVDEGFFPNTFQGVSKGSFDFTEVLLGAGADVTDNLRVGAQLISRNFGEQGDYNTSLDWGYGDYQFNEKIGIRIGRVKNPSGLYGESRDIDSARTSILLDQAIYDETFRSFTVAYNGAGLYGTLEDENGTFGSLDYELHYGTLEIPDDFFFSTLLNSYRGGSGKGLESEDLIGGQIFWNTPLEGLRIGYTVSRFNSHTDLLRDPTNFLNTGGEVSEAYSLNADTDILSIEYTWEDWVFFGETSKFKLASDIKYAELGLVDDLINKLTQLSQAAGVLTGLQSAQATLADPNSSVTQITEAQQTLATLAPQAAAATTTLATLQAELTAAGLAFNGSSPANDRTSLNLNLAGLNNETNNEIRSWYLGLGYIFTDQLQGTLRYSQSDSLLGIEKQIMTLSLRYDVNESWVTKAEYHGVKTDTTNTTTNVTTTDNNGALLLRASYSF